MGHQMRYQKGMGLLGILVIASMAGFFVMAGIKITPGYFEYQVIKKNVIRAAEEFEEDRDTISDIRRDLETYFNTNQVKLLRARDILIERKSGHIEINANFEHRIPLLWRIDAVVKYDDLTFIAGESYSE